MRFPRSWTIAIAIISIAILSLWLITSIYALYVQVSWTTPWLATPILIGILVLIAIAIAIVVYYVGLFQGWWGKSSTNSPQLPKVPVERTAAATANLQAIDLQLQQIQDEVTRQALIDKSREIAENLARGQIRVVVFGTRSWSPHRGSSAMR